MPALLLETFLLNITWLRILQGPWNVSYIYICFFPCYYIQGSSSCCHNPSLVPGHYWKALRWIVDGILNWEHFQQQNLDFPSLDSLCLCLSLFRCLSLSHTNTHYLAAKDSCSQLFPIQFIPPQPSFLSVIQQHLAKELLHLGSFGVPAFQQAVVFFTVFQMDASGLVVYHGTHTQALVSPHSSLSTKFLHISVATEIPPLNTSCSTQRPKPSQTRSLTGGHRLVSCCPS